MDKKFRGTGLLVSIACLLFFAWSCKGKHESHDKHNASGNPLKQEMALLQDAYDSTIRVLMLGGDTQAIVHAFHAVHEAKHHTEKALENKEITLPKNGDNIDEFMKLDGEFHGLIEKLVEAARKNDRVAIQARSAEMLDGCIGCHQKFRNP